MEILNDNNIKQTKARKLVLEYLQNTKLPVTAEEIYSTTGINNNINLSTIYRTLNILTSKYIITKHIRADKMGYYQINNHQHKHVLVCEDCGKTVLLSDCPLKNVISQVEANTDFKITSHNIEFFGKCKNCE